MSQLQEAFAPVRWCLDSKGNHDDATPLFKAMPETSKCFVTILRKVQKTLFLLSQCALLLLLLQGVDRVTEALGDKTKAPSTAIAVALMLNQIHLEAAKLEPFFEKHLPPKVSQLVCRPVF
jgi:hypothetical protein